MSASAPDPLVHVLRRLRPGCTLTDTEAGAIALLVGLLRDERKLTAFLEPIFAKTTPTYARPIAAHAAHNLRATVVEALTLEALSYECNEHHLAQRRRQHAP